MLDRPTGWQTLPINYNWYTTKKYKTVLCMSLSNERPFITPVAGGITQTLIIFFYIDMGHAVYIFNENKKPVQIWTKKNIKLDILTTWSRTSPLMNEL